MNSLSDLAQLKKTYKNLKEALTETENLINELEGQELDIEKYPPAGFPCEVWDDGCDDRQLMYATGDGNFASTNVAGHRPYTFAHWQPAGIPDRADWPSYVEAYIFWYDGVVEAVEKPEIYDYSGSVWIERKERKV